MMFEKKMKKCNDGLYLAFRIIVGVLFLSHGLGKYMPGFLGPGNIAGFTSFLGLGQVAHLVAVGEILVGLGILFGFWARLSAVGGIVIMLGAIGLKHWPTDFSSVGAVLGGLEVLLLYIAAFIVVLVMGNGKYSVEKVLLKKETF